MQCEPECLQAVAMLRDSKPSPQQQSGSLPVQATYQHWIRKTDNIVRIGFCRLCLNQIPENRHAVSFMSDGVLPSQIKERQCLEGEHIISPCKGKHMAALDIRRAQLMRY